LLQQLQGLSDEVSEVESLPLAVFDLVANARIVVAEDVEDRQDLAVVWHQGLSDHVS
jgi:hypothetical protein